jgi:hypothetical protein
MMFGPSTKELTYKHVEVVADELELVPGLRVAIGQAIVQQLMKKLWEAVESGGPFVVQCGKLEEREMDTAIMGRLKAFTQRCQVARVAEMDQGDVIQLLRFVKPHVEAPGSGLMASSGLWSAFLADLFQQIKAALDEAGVPDGPADYSEYGRQVERVKVLVKNLKAGGNDGMSEPLYQGPYKVLEISASVFMPALLEKAVTPEFEVVDGFPAGTECVYAFWIQHDTAVSRPDVKTLTVGRVGLLLKHESWPLVACDSVWEIPRAVLGYQRRNPC